MKLQKQLSRKVGNKEYIKYVITIPAKKIEKLGWNQHTELEMEVSKSTAKLKPKNKSK